MSVEASLSADGVLMIEGSERNDSISIVGDQDGTVYVRDLNQRGVHKFSDVSKIHVKTLGGDDQVRVQTRGMEQVDLTVDAGDGDNAILIGLLLPAVQKVREAAAEPADRLDLTTGQDPSTIGLLLPAVQKVREAAARVHVVTGDSDDRINVRTQGMEQVDLKIDSGGGDDTALIGLLLPAVQKVREAAARPAGNLDLSTGEGPNTTGLLLPAVQKVRESAARMQINTDSGDDRVSVRTDGISQVDLDLDSGSGDDDVRIGLLLPAVQKAQEGPAEDETADPGPRVPVDLNVTTGEGDDSVAIGLLLPAVQKVREAAARMQIDLGSGDDKATIRSLGATAVDLVLAADSGDDDVAVALLLPAVQKVREAAARVHIDLGSGQDDLKLRIEGYDHVDTTIEGEESARFGDGSVRSVRPVLLRTGDSSGK
jgi:hypothetical protein